MKTTFFHVQGHRGARGLQPENTLPAFEVAWDLGVTSIETDLHLTRDAVPVLMHDATLHESGARLLPGSSSPSPQSRPLRPPHKELRQLTLAELRGYAVDRNPDPQRFPHQRATVTPLARWFAAAHGLHPYTPPRLADLIEFWRAYGAQPGTNVGKTPAQQERVRRSLFDLELKRVPFRPSTLDDGFTGQEVAVLERCVLDLIRQAGLLEQTVVRSFDHRSVLALRRLEPRLTTAVLVANMAPVQPVELVRAAEANLYCPEVNFLDERQVEQLRQAGVGVLPWTVNDADSWQRLLAWGVTGCTTDFPDQLTDWLRVRGVNW